MTDEVLTGVPELDQKFKELGGKAATRLSRKATNAGLIVIEKSIKSAAPKGKTGGLGRSVGRRNKKRRSADLAEAKTGIGVGKKRGLAAPHAHLVALGTKRRIRKKIGGRFALRFAQHPPTDKQLATGVMPSNDFVRVAYERSKTEAKDKMIDVLAKGVEAEAAK